MSKVVKCDPSQLQMGDQVIVANKTWTLQSLNGPDRIGTYDLYLSDNEGHTTATFTTEPVTIIM
jgi:hypothetical protein